MDITLSTIFRDCEMYLEYALASVLPHCTAAVLVDTGSVDRTPEIIQDMCATHIPSGRWRLLHTEWLGFGPSRELAMRYIPDGWLWKTGGDEIYFDSASEIPGALQTFWDTTDHYYLYPVEITFEGSHCHSQYGMEPKPGMNTRSQLFRIENKKYRYSWNHMVTNDDLSKTDKETGEFTFLGPLCGNSDTVKQDPKFTAFVTGDDKPNSIHFAKCTKERLEWKTKTYRELVPNWDDETMGDPQPEKLYKGPWPEVLYDEDGNLPKWLQLDIDKYA